MRRSQAGGVLSSLGRPLVGACTLPVRAAVSSAALAGRSAGAAGRLGRGAASAVTAPVRSAAAREATHFASAASPALARAERVTRTLAAGAAASTDLGRRRSRRRVWSRAGRAHIEIRGLCGPGTARLSRDVTRALSAVDGVHRAEVNAVTAQVLVDFDEHTAPLPGLIAVIEEIERAHGTADATFDWSEPPHPADDAPALWAATALAADLLGLAAAATSRVLPAARLPAAIRAPVVFVEGHPQSRLAVQRRFGPAGGDLLLTIGSAVTHGLSRGMSPLAVDALARALQLGEARSNRAVWERRERELHPDGHPLPSLRPPRRARPARLPDGPVEKVGSATSLAAVAGAGGTLAWSRDPGRAADLILATAPKAARLGREAFAATLGIGLTRRGMVPLDGSALRRLDRVSAVVIDSEVLCTQRPRLISADGDAGPPSWQAAGRVLAAHTLTDLAGPGPWEAHGWRLDRAPGDAGTGIAGPSGLLVDLRDRHGRHHGPFLVGCELDLHAEALLGAARDSARHVVLTEHVSTGELAGWADEVAAASHGSLARQVRRLQLRGHGVMVLSCADGPALDAADVGITVLTATHGVCWLADLVCGPGLADAWRLLRAGAAAHRASDRAARLSVGGSAIGALLTTTGQGSRRTGVGVAPIQSAALAAMISGAAGARATIRAPEPAAVPRGDWHAMSAGDALARLRAARLGRTPPAGREGGRSAVPGPTAPVRPLTEAIRPVLARAAGSRLVSAAVVAPARGAAQLAGAVRHELQDPLTPVLALGAMASAVVGSGVDALLVSGVMAGNALISGAQRLRAEHSLGRLLMREQISARQVLWAVPAGRDLTHPGSGSPERSGPRSRAAPYGKRAEPDFTGLAEAPERTAPALALEPGDVIALRPSDVVPADARLLRCDGLEVDESALTGESLPVGKASDPVPGAALTDRTCMVYEGSTVLAGHGFAVVTATGGATEAGKAALAAGRGAPATGLQARLAELTRISVPASGAGGLAVAGLGLIRGVPLRQAVASGVAVAVAAVPEGLPLVATVAQLAAARRLTGTGVLARSSRALEALGRVDVLCFDKTGTLTQGRLTVTALASPEAVVEFTSPQARYLLHVAARACPPVDGDGMRVLPHATDRAVMESARARAGADPSWRLAEELPFEASRGYSAALGRSAGATRLAVKGAPEVVLPRCATVAARGTASPGRPPAAMPMTAARRRQAERVLGELAAQGLRVLAVAEAELPGPLGGYHLAPNGHPGSHGNGRQGNGRAGTREQPGRDPHPGHGQHRPVVTEPGPGHAPGWGGNGGDEIVTGLTLTGFVAIADTLRPSAKAAVDRLTEAGVRVTMITGDHPATAAAIARKLGLPDAGRVLTGEELASLPESTRTRRIAEAAVFARVSPEQKVRIVESLQRAGHVVAMTGDGVNDAAAIRLADVGIGVRAHGSTSARSAADLIITDSDPVHILDALLEGRALWARVRDAVSILVGGNAGEVAFTLLGTAVTGRAPLSTRQLLLVNMLTDMLPALAVAIAPSHPPRNGEDRLVSGGPVGPFLAPELGRSLVIRGGATALGASAAWQAGRITGRQRRADTMGLAAVVLTQLGQTLLTSGGRSPLTLATSAVSAGALVTIVETPGVSQFFGCTPLGPVAWAMAAGSATGATIAAALTPRLLAARRFEPVAALTPSAGTAPAAPVPPRKA